MAMGDKDMGDVRGCKSVFIQLFFKRLFSKTSVEQDGTVGVRQQVAGRKPVF